MNEPLTIKIERFPSDALADLQHNIHHFYELCGLSLMVADAPVDEIRLPGTAFDIVAGAEVRDISLVRTELQNWVLRSGMRDCLESVAGFLNEIRNQCALSSLLMGGSQCKTKKFECDITRANRNFGNLSLSKKIEDLEKAYLLQIPAELKDAILNLNWVRNILVHQFGRPGEQDVNSAGVFIVRWHALQLFFSGPQGSRNVEELPSVGREGEALMMTRLPRKKTYALGESIVFSAKEFSEICFTFYWFGMAVSESCESHFKRCGYIEVPKPSQWHWT